MLKRLAFVVIIGCTAGALHAQAPASDPAGDQVEATCRTATPDACWSAVEKYSSIGPAQAVRSRSIAQHRCEIDKDALMCVGYGYMLETGVGGPTDAPASVAYYKTGCDGNIGVGCSNLAVRLVAAPTTEANRARAFEAMSKACTLEYWAACTSAGTYLRDGIGTARNYAKARQLFDQACTRSNANGCVNAAASYADTAFGPINEQAAIVRYKSACDLKSGSACNSLGIWVETGRGGLTAIPDSIRATALYTTACDYDNGDGCANAAINYLNGFGTKPDSARAFQLRLKACSLHLARGCADVGYGYDYGVGTPASPAKAPPFYMESCDSSGGRYGCRLLAIMLQQGRGGLAIDSARALTLITRACNAGDAYACNDLGNAAFNASGMARDVKLASRSYRLSCNGGNSAGCTNYAMMLQTGDGGDHDDSLAVRLLQGPCAEGIANACGFLGDAYNYQRGAPLNESLALSLYMKACAGGQAYACTRQHTLEAQHVSPAPMAAPAGAGAATKVAARGDDTPHAAPATGAAPVRTDRYALVVGISRYRADTTRIAPLCCARSDAQEMYGILTSPNGGNFARDHVKLLVDEQATGGEVRSGLLDFLGRATPNDLVIIYIAGHASEVPNQGVFLLTNDIDLDKPSSAGIPMDELNLDITRLHAEKVVAFIDVCHGGAASSVGMRGDAGGSNAAVSRYLEELQRARDGRVIFAASQSYESALEGAPYGGHGAFTEALLSGLRGGARGDDFIVTLGELVNYTTARVAKMTNDRQHPDIGHVTQNWDPSLPMAVLTPPANAR